MKIYPFSFKEFLKYYEFEDIDLAFDKYVLEGGLSGSYLYKTDEDKYNYISEVYKTLIVRDIIKRYKIKNKELLDNLNDFLMNNISNITTARNITKELNVNGTGINHKTIGSYIKYLCNAFLYYNVKRYDIQGKKYLTMQEKYYLVDQGFKYARLGTKNINYGKTYENIVAIELLRCGYELYVGILYNKEVDFVAIKQNEKIEFIDVLGTHTRICLDVIRFNDDLNSKEDRTKIIIPFQIAYAVSIHKAQGLEYDSVKLIIPSCNAEKISHSVFYTAITRAKNELKIFWSAETMQEIVNEFYEERDEQRTLSIIKNKLGLK